MSLSSAFVYAGLPGVVKIDMVAAIKSRQVKAKSKIPDKLIDEVCRLYGITKKEIMSRSRVLEIVEARQLCMYILYTVCGLTLNTIGSKIFSGFDHTTVMHSRNTIQNHAETEEILKKRIDYLMQFIGL